MTRVVPFTDGSERPLGKILAVGRNYADHAREMNAPAEPVIFLKPPTAIRVPGEAVALPRDRGRIDHEIELLVWLRDGGAGLDPVAAAATIGGYGLGLDLTLRDVQARAKEGGKPWTLAKGFDGSLPVSRFIPADRVSDPGALRFRLTVDGVVRQEGCATDMLLSVPELLAYVSGWITLEAGDLILTGTPSGVGPVVPGSSAVLTLDGVFDHRVDFV